MTGRLDERGFVATELVLGIGLLVLPVALLVLTLPGWSERQVTARVISREVARRTARDGVCDLGSAAGARDHDGPQPRRPRRRRARSTSVVRRRRRLVPGSDVEARVTVRMPAVELPGLGAVEAWSWTARHRQPVDRYAAPA